MATHRDRHSRSVLPIPDVQKSQLTALDAKHPDSRFPRSSRSSRRPGRRTSSSSSARGSGGGRLRRGLEVPVRSALLERAAPRSDCREEVAPHVDVLVLRVVAGRVVAVPQPRRELGGARGWSVRACSRCSAGRTSSGSSHTGAPPPTRLSRPPSPGSKRWISRRERPDRAKQRTPAWGRTQAGVSSGVARRQWLALPLASSSDRRTASRLNEAGFWRGGNFLKVSIWPATNPCIRYMR